MWQIQDGFIFLTKNSHNIQRGVLHFLTHDAALGGEQYAAVSIKRQEELGKIYLYCTYLQVKYIKISKNF